MSNSKITTQQFILESKQRFQDKFDYSLTEYINKNTPLILICPVHEEFKITRRNHLRSPLGCPECFYDTLRKPKKVFDRITRYTKELFIQESKKLYPDNFDYDEIEFIRIAKKIELKCKYHTYFPVIPSEHLNPKILNGCPYCQNKKKIKRTQKMFLWECFQKHGTKFDYSLVNFVSMEDDIQIACPEHGLKNVTPKYHLTSKYGCPSCGGTEKYTTETFIAQAKKVCFENYDYSLVKYVNNKERVWFICPEKHKFPMRPNNFLSGQRCPVCADLKEVSEEENQLYKWVLENISKSAVQSYRPSWMIYSKKDNFPKEIDIYIPELNLGIEYNGSYFHSENFNKKFKYHHKWKYLKSLENNINLLFIWDFENLEEWKIKLLSYKEIPENFKISFSNQNYVIGKYSLWGKSFITYFE